eukprot:CAMPEP_0113677064 /NCGR_PEP_ID=MMETSP0038_2-20120614/9035_1 /TAXON_ID=2898 /ORGANISM="Cryptomonas paramecium" /LENGTH=79 /DNA_ID=CAMNT_0000594251 /DNA_START=712 /DNA_END=953 /DNA_ORIENTATION=- /assembly_acc=CAM_ASM_000170
MAMWMVMRSSSSLVKLSLEAPGNQQMKKRAVSRSAVSRSVVKAQPEKPEALGVPDGTGALTSVRAIIDDEVKFEGKSMD